MWKTSGTAMMVENSDRVDDNREPNKHRQNYRK